MLKVTLKTRATEEMLIRKGKTRAWLAFKLDSSSGYISQILSGKRNPSPRLRGRLLQIFKGSKFDDLFIIHK